MRRRTAWFSAAIVLGCSASPPNVPLSDVQRAAIEDSVRATTDSVFAAGNRKDLDRMFSFYSANTTLLRDGKYEAWAEHQAGARAFYATLKAVDLRALDHTVEVLSPTAAIWRGRYRFSLTPQSGKPIAGTAANTWVLTRETTGWRIIHVHISDPMPAAK